jgi:hypothetical protein
MFFNFWTTTSNIDSIRVCGHGRGSGFDSGRPCHWFQKSFASFAQTNERANGHVFAAFRRLEPFSRRGFSQGVA